MDLSLQGSQINLATRDKPNIRNVKYPVIHNRQRPGSANNYFSSRFSRNSSPSLERPLSADNTRLAKSLNNCVRFSDNILKDNSNRLIKNNYGSSTSSSNILKLLLDEPIKKNWSRKDCDEKSDSSLGNKISKLAANHRAKQKIESSEESSIEGAGDIQTQTDSVDSRMNTNTPAYNINYNDSESVNNGPAYQQSSVLVSSTTATAGKRILGTAQGDFWHKTKDDVPGRVSFNKSDVYAFDGSDNENEFDISDNRKEFSSQSQQKKMVHFQENVEITAYPGVENTVNSTENTPSGTDHCSSVYAKCFCSLSCNSTKTIFEPNYSNSTVQLIEPLNEKNPIVKDYKQQIEDDDRKIQLELKILGKDYEGHQFSEYLTNFLMERSPQEDLSMPAVAKDYAQVQNNENFLQTSDEQNDLAQNRNLNQIISLKESSKKFILSNDIFKSSELNNFHTSENRTNITASVSPVINNYLKVSERPSTSNSNANGNTSKKLNNLPNLSKTTNSYENGLKNRRIKSAIPISTLKDNSTTNSDKQKVRQPEYSRQDSRLGEFKIDKVDSWMSLHDDLRFHTGTSPSDGESTSNEANTDCCDENIIRNQSAELDASNKNSIPDDEDSTSTYDEIVSVIKEIEEDKRKEESSDERNNMSLKLQKLIQSSDTPDSAISLDKTESPDKLRDILNYLDNVENSCEKTLLETTRRSIPSESSRSEIEFAIESDIIEDVPKIADLLMLPNHQLARRVVTLSLRANELANAIVLSKEHMKHIRCERQKQLRQEKQNANARFKEQKQHYEGIVARHQGFIEQLLKDKSILCEKVTALVRRIDSQNQAWEHKLETELSRCKDACLAAEKIRRERWVRENTKKIKELTIKGIEGEINNMTTEHQQQISNLKRQHQQELLDTVEDLRIKQEHLEKSIRQSFTEDRETVITKERNAIRERFESQILDEQKSFDEQKNKLLEDFAVERERLAGELRQRDSDFERKKQVMLEEREDALERTYDEYKDKMHQQEQKYQARISTIQKQFETDFLIWKREYENARKLREVENENTIREHYRMERDRQIDQIVTKMDMESQKSQEEFEMKFSRLKSKYEADLMQAEQAENILREKFNETRTKLAESEAKVQNLQAELKQLQIELDHSKKMCNEFLNEKELMKENARKEIQTEVTALQTERDNEIQKIYKRVQQAIEKKDASLELLQKDNITLRERCIKLEAVIRQQRKDYCIK